MLGEIPELQPVYDEHMKDYDELLGHVFMGDVTRFVVSAYKRSTSDEPNAEQWHQVLDRSLAFMEQALTMGDLYVEDIIQLSFLENLLPSSDDDVKAYRAIKLMLGPKLREELQAMLKYRGLSEEY
jgi:hypothetical protein